LIPQAFIDAWNRTVPWPDDNQIEQDLILSRLIVEIANHELWHVLTDLRPDEGRIVDGLRHYMKEETFTFSDLATNLRDKIAHVEFRDDLRGLVRELPAGYELAAAADLVMERLAVGLDGAPELSHIQGGAWRR